MDFITVNVGVALIVYCIIEILKRTLLKTDRRKAMIPAIAIIIGAAIACSIYILFPSGLPTCNSIIDALGLGGMSGCSSVGYNQIYKQYTKFTNPYTNYEFKDDDKDDGADA